MEALSVLLRPSLPVFPVIIRGSPCQMVRRTTFAVRGYSLCKPDQLFTPFFLPPVHSLYARPNAIYNEKTHDSGKEKKSMIRDTFFADVVTIHVIISP